MVTDFIAFEYSLPTATGRSPVGKPAHMASSQRDGENVHPSAPRVVEPRQYPLQSLPSNQIFSPEAFRTPQHKYSSSTPAPDPIARLVDLQTRHAALLDGIEQAQRSAEQVGWICCAIVWCCEELPGGAA